MNAVLPTLQLFRLVDVKDDNDHLHHGYQFLFTGDPEMALKGHLSCTITGDSTVELTIPGPAASFVNNYKETVDELKRKKKILQPACNAHATAIGRYQEYKDLVRCKYLFKFDNTGEKLTNAVFSSGGQRFGPVQPTTALIVRAFEFGGKAYPTTDLYAAFNIARVEPRPRKAIVSEKKSGNLVVDSLLEDVQGMNLDGYYDS